MSVRGVDRSGNAISRPSPSNGELASVLSERLQGSGHDETLVDALFAIADALKQQADDTLAVVLEQGLARIADALDEVASALRRE